MRKNRSGLAVGLLLIVLGGWFLAVQLVPGLDDWFWGFADWPFIVIGVGLFLLIFGLLVGAPGMAVPAMIVGGIGGILAYQNATNDWSSWSYAWTLIPGFAGLGGMLAALLGEGGKKGFSGGFSTVMVSLVMFLIFSSFFGVTPFGDWWPLVIIALGLWLLLRAFLRRR
jgi:hypothetical protein